MKRVNILVTGVGGPAGINICKLLMKEKKYFNIFGIDISSHSAGQFMTHQFFICERVSDEKKYLDFMADFIKKNKIKIVVPTVAEELVLMEKLRNRIPKDVVVLVSEHEVLALCDEKNKLYAWMDKNFPMYMGKWARLNKFPSWKSTSYFIKPIKGRGSRGCRLVTAIELKHLLKTNKKEMQNFIAMEVLPGKEWTVDAYVNTDGSFAYIVPRLRLGLSGGISTLGRTDKRKDVIETAKNIFNKMKCFGPVFVQLKEDVNGIPKMVEINPRASGGLTITALSGANTVSCLVADLVKKKALKDVKWKEVTVTRYFEERIVKDKSK